MPFYKFKINPKGFKFIYDGSLIKLELHNKEILVEAPDSYDAHRLAFAIHRQRCLSHFETAFENLENNCKNDYWSIENVEVVK